jgi:hypothetical protein
MYKQYVERLEFIKYMDKLVNFNCDKLINFVKEEKPFDHGMNSYVYKLKIKDDIILVKKQNVEKEIETEILLKLKNLITSNICPHFNYLFDHKKCDKTTFLLQELISFPLSKWLTNDRSHIEWLVFYFQLFYVAYIMEKHLGYQNIDIKISNMTYFEIQKGGFIEYIINDKKFYVPNIGIIFVLIDHGNVTNEINHNSFILKKIIQITQSIKFYNLLCQYTLKELLKLNPGAQSIVDSTNEYYKQFDNYDKEIIDERITKRVILKYMMKSKDKITLKYPPSSVNNFLRSINLKNSLQDNFASFDKFKSREDNIILTIRDFV